MKLHGTRLICPAACQYGFLFSILRDVKTHCDKQLREQRRGTRIPSRLCTVLAPAFQFTVNQDNAGQPHPDHEIHTLRYMRYLDVVDSLPSQHQFFGFFFWAMSETAARRQMII